MMMIMMTMMKWWYDLGKFQPLSKMPAPSLWVYQKLFQSIKATIRMPQVAGNPPNLTWILSPKCAYWDFHDIRDFWSKNIFFGISATEMQRFQIFWFPHMDNLLEPASKKQHTCKWISYYLTINRLRIEGWGLRTEYFHPLRPQKSSTILINWKNPPNAVCRIVQHVPPWPLWQGAIWPCARLLQS